MLHSAPRDDPEAGRASALSDLGEQRALAEPRLAQQPEHSARASPHISDRARRRSQLPITPQQLHERIDGGLDRAIPGGARELPRGLP